MPGAELDRVLWSVAARYGFSEAEMWAMPVSRLLFWYEGHQFMYREEQQRMKEILGGKRSGGT